MRKTMCVIILLWISFVAGYAQDFVGSWSGVLEVSGQKITLIFHIDAEGKGLTATMDIPAQGAKGLKANEIVVTDSMLKLVFTQLGITYEGRLQIGKQYIEGSYKQSGLTFPLKLEPLSADEAVSGFNRPQEPKPPFPYESEEVFFANGKAGITLAGTLTSPNGDGPFPAVILVSGSGPQNRDEELFGHKPFLVIADYLTRQGVAVLRYDDRGVGHSEGDFGSATSVDFADDAAAAFAYLKNKENIDSSKVGFIGHSEGGMVAPMVAAQHKDVAFLVLLAAPGLPIDSFMVLQNRLIGKAFGMNEQALDQAAAINRELYAMLKDNHEEDSIRNRVADYLGNTMRQQGIPASAIDEQINSQLSTLFSPWYRYFIAHNPQEVLVKVSCPVFALNGSKDTQVGAEENLTAIQTALQESGNTNVDIKQFAGLNHLFQPAETGLHNEYGSIEQTIAPNVLEEIAGWLHQTLR